MWIYLWDTTLVNGGWGWGMEHFCCLGPLVTVKVCKAPASGWTCRDSCGKCFTVPFSGRRIYAIGNCDWWCPIGNCYRSCSFFISEPLNGYRETIFAFWNGVYTCWPQGCCYTHYPTGVVYLEEGVCYYIWTGLTRCDGCTWKCTCFTICCRWRKSP